MDDYVIQIEHSSKRDAAIYRASQKFSVMGAKTSFHLINDVSSQTVPEEFTAAGFDISADEAGSIVESQSHEKLTAHGGVDGVAKKLKTSTIDGLDMDAKELTCRQQLFGTNEFTGRKQRDGLFLSGLAVSVDQSSLTGESEPVKVNSENPYLLSGSKIEDGSCKMLVTAVGMRTQWGKLMADLTEGGNNETPLQVKLKRMAIIIGKIGFIFAIVPLAVSVQKLFACKIGEGRQWRWSSDDALMLLGYLFDIVVAIAGLAIPKRPPLAVTLSLAFAMKKMMNDKVLVRNLAACETMGSVTTICSDKTGTLTTNHMMVVKSCICMNVNKEEIPDSAKKILIQSIFTNTIAEVVVNEEGKREILGTPTETAMLEFGLLLGGDFQSECESTKVIRVEPFNSRKKQMGVVLELPEGGVRAHCKGASEIVLAACDKVINENGEVVALEEESLNRLKSTIDSFAGEALRTLCLAYIDLESGFTAETPVPSNGYTCIGIVGIKDPVRPGVKESVALCRSAGITVRMVTGDNITTAKAIARECGILTDDGIVIEGPDFRKKSLEELLEIIPKIQVMARASPQDKLTLVKYLRTSFGEVVAVAGNGTDNAPALHEEDIGFAMGIAGAEVAKENADVIVLDDNFSRMITLVRWGQSVYNIQKFVQFQLTVNIVALIVNFTSACLTGSAPLMAVQLLWVSMIMNTFGALALAIEPPNNELMERAPVGRNRNFTISNVMWRNISGQALYQFAVIGLLQLKGKSFFSLDGGNSDLILNTLIFNSFVFCQLFNMVNSRKMEKENVLDGLWKNTVFVSVVAAIVVFQVVIVEYLGTFANNVATYSHTVVV
ncbi:putative P-type ATPase, HAD superfamily, P-type ATPase, transmembrane domain superfamily [Helianthus annuus]|nr:putative P-type ATPase, HAD superfamily, P-type ATPase, transmembrane domain superfamily [Helianthus annuus]